MVCVYVRVWFLNVCWTCDTRLETIKSSRPGLNKFWWLLVHAFPQALIQVVNQMTVVVGDDTFEMHLSIPIHLVNILFLSRSPRLPFSCRSHYRINDCHSHLLARITPRDICGAKSTRVFCDSLVVGDHRLSQLVLNGQITILTKIKNKSLEWFRTFL